MRKFRYIFGLIIIGMIVSCNHEIDIDTTEQVEIAGEWEVSAFINSSFIDGPFIVKIKDSSIGNDSITIKDEEIKFWNFQVKAAVDQKNGTFETKLSQCELSNRNIGIKLPIGKIINSDSIYFEIQFEDDMTPYGFTYQIKGRRINL